MDFQLPTFNEPPAPTFSGMLQTSCADLTDGNMTKTAPCNDGKGICIGNATDGSWECAELQPPDGKCAVWANATQKHACNNNTGFCEKLGRVWVCRRFFRQETCQSHDGLIGQPCCVQCDDDAPQILLGNCSKQYCIGTMDVVIPEKVRIQVLLLDFPSV